MALTTRTAVKNQCGISSADTSHDAQIDSLILGMTALVKQYLNRDLEQSTYTEYYSGNNSPYLLLRQYPVTAVTRVCIDNGGYAGQAPGAFPSSDDLVQGVDYMVDPGQKSVGVGGTGIGATGILRRINDVWYGRPYRKLGVVRNLPTETQGNILVQYTAGFNPVPAAIQMAINGAIGRYVMFAQLGGAVTSATYEDASITLMNPDDEAKVFGSIKQSLGNYKSIPV